MRLKGADDLERRFRALADAPEAMTKAIAEQTRDALERTMPVKSGAGRDSLEVAVSGTDVEFKANHYMHIRDVGAQAHDIEPARADVLVFPSAGRTIFARKVHMPQQRGLGFAERALEDGASGLDDVVIDIWNRSA